MTSPAYMARRGFLAAAGLALAGCVTTRSGTATPTIDGLSLAKPGSMR